MMSPKQILCIEDEAAIVLPLRYALEREAGMSVGQIRGLKALQFFQNKLLILLF